MLDNLVHSGVVTKVGAHIGIIRGEPPEGKVLYGNRLGIAPYRTVSCLSPITKVIAKASVLYTLVSHPHDFVH